MIVKNNPLVDLIGDLQYAETHIGDLGAILFPELDPKNYPPLSQWKDALVKLASAGGGSNMVRLVGWQTTIQSQGGASVNIDGPSYYFVADLPKPPKDAPYTNWVNIASALLKLQQAKLMPPIPHNYVAWGSHYWPIQGWIKPAPTIPRVDIFGIAYHGHNAVTFITSRSNQNRMEVSLYGGISATSGWNYLTIPLGEL